MRYKLLNNCLSLVSLLILAIGLGCDGKGSREVASCNEIVTQIDCDGAKVANETCSWLHDQCGFTSKLLTEFQATGTGFVVKGIDNLNLSSAHSELVDVMGEIVGVGPLSTGVTEISFTRPKAGELVYYVKKTSAQGNEYKFTYDAIDLDADTMLIKLKAATPKLATVSGEKNVDVAKVFAQAKLMYQKSQNRILFLLVYKKKDQSKFPFKTPADFKPGAKGGGPTYFDDGKGPPHIALIFE